jgi:hypothetical protein
MKQKKRSKRAYARTGLEPVPQVSTPLELRKPVRYRERKERLALEESELQGLAIKRHKRQTGENRQILGLQEARPVQKRNATAFQNHRERKTQTELIRDKNGFIIQTVKDTISELFSE